MPTIGTYYYDGNSFINATGIWTNNTMTVVAPDGWYMVGNIYREMSGGVLNAAINCPTCVVPCGDPFSFGSGSTGVYILQMDLGNVPGAAVITFSPGSNSWTTRPIPDTLSWNYFNSFGNPLVSSECSSLVAGYQRGLIGAPDGPPKGGVQCNAFTATGKNSVAGGLFVWDIATSSFVSAGSTTIDPITGISTNISSSQNYDPTGVLSWRGSLESTLLDWNCTSTQQGQPNYPCTAPGCTNCANGQPLLQPVNGSGVTPAAPNLPTSARWPVTNGEWRGATYVVPSPPGVTNNTLTLVITAPCSGTWWGIDVQCPRELTALNSSAMLPQGTAKATVCAATVNQQIYHVPVDAFGDSNENSVYFDGSSFPNPTTTGPSGNAQPDGTLGLHDWVFSDPYGETPLPVGEYKVESPVGSGVYYWVEVGVREYKDVNANGHALPPENYTAYAPNVQSTGSYYPGIVKSMTPC
tara:strand:+ start:2564 stop:3964 length:1401 start_codon:yes stop_codon:yes gene_type:complete